MAMPTSKDKGARRKIVKIEKIKRKHSTHPVLVYPIHEHIPERQFREIARLMLPEGNTWTIRQRSEVPKRILSDISDPTMTLWVCICKCSEHYFIDRVQEIVSARHGQGVRLLLFNDLQIPEVLDSLESIPVPEELDASGMRELVSYIKENSSRYS